MKKIHKLQIFRFLVQIIFLILFPGLITLTFAGLREIYLFLLSGKPDLLQLLPQLTEVIVIIPLTIFLGRFFCGWFCVFGTFNDFMYMISKKIFKRKFKINKRLDSNLKLLKYLVLIFIVWFIWTKKSNFFASTSPWDALAQITDIKDAFITYASGFLLLAAISLGAMFIERFFCRYLCPMGAFFSIISLVRGFKIDKPNDQCGKCRLCTMECSMGIQLYSTSKVTSGECINCMKCVGICPRKNVHPHIYGEKYNPALASAFVIAAFTGFYTVGNITSNAIETSISPKIVAATSNSLNHNSSDNTSMSDLRNKVSNVSNKHTATSSVSSSHHLYKDGTFTGTGTGFRPGMQVAVTIKNDKITSVEILSSNDTRRFSSEAFNVIPQEIMQSQSTRVDTVSGATRSSNGVLMAVADALNQAKIA